MAGPKRSGHLSQTPETVRIWQQLRTQYKFRTDKQVGTRKDQEGRRNCRPLFCIWPELDCLPPANCELSLHRPLQVLRILGMKSPFGKRMVPQVEQDITY